MATPLALMYADGGRRRTSPPPDPKSLTAFMARMRAARGEDPLSLVETSPVGAIDADPADVFEHPDLAGMGVRTPVTTPGGVGAYPLPPGDPLRRDIPRAPAAPDLAAVEAEERGALEQEAGPRIKENPRGWKGKLLGAVKGLVGLAEGYAASGARDWQDAVGSMAQGAARRIRDYQTNREDSVPFDEELNRRVQERVRPMVQKYGQEKQTYSDAMDRYKIETDVEDRDHARTDKERAFRLQERQADALDQYRQDQLDRQRENDRLTYQAKLDQARARVREGIERQQNARLKGQQAARQKYLDAETKRLDGMENQYIKELETLNKAKAEKYDESSGAWSLDAGTKNNINAQIASVQQRLDAVRQQQTANADRYAALADETATIEAGGAAGGLSPDVAAQAKQIREEFNAGRLTRAQATAALRALGFR